MLIAHIAILHSRAPTRRQHPGFVCSAWLRADLQPIMRLVDAELSEPYSIFTYRYFLRTCPELCWVALESGGGKCVGTVVCKLDWHRSLYRGYIAMLVVDKEWRHMRLGTALARVAIQAMADKGAYECVLEAESCNHGALRLYERLGFVRDKRLEKCVWQAPGLAFVPSLFQDLSPSFACRYYLSGNDAFRLKLVLPPFWENFLANRADQNPPSSSPGAENNASPP